MRPADRIKLRNSIPASPSQEKASCTSLPIVWVAFVSVPLGCLHLFEVQLLQHCCQVMTILVYLAQTLVERLIQEPGGIEGVSRQSLVALPLFEHAYEQAEYQYGY